MSVIESAHKSEVDDRGLIIGSNNEYFQKNSQQDENDEGMHHRLDPSLVACEFDLRSFHS